MRQDGYGEIGDLVAVMVEHRQPLMPFEDGVPGAGSGRPGGAVGVVEVEETALAAAGDSGPEQRVGRAHVIEDAVEHERHAPVPAGLCEAVEDGVVAESRIDAEVVGGVVPVGARLEDRPECQTAGAQVDEVVEPCDEALETGCGRPVGWAGRPDRGSGGAQGIDVPPDAVLDPCWEAPIARFSYSSTLTTHASEGTH